MVNARHVKQVSDRKTDVKDSQWLASLAHCGLLKPSFISPKDLRGLRLISRYCLKLQGNLASEKNRLHKVLSDGGIQLSNVVSDINGVSAREMIQGLIAGKQVEALVKCARGRLKKKTDELQESLEGPFSERHRFLLKEIQSHITHIEQEIQRLNTFLLEVMQPYRKQ